MVIFHSYVKLPEGMFAVHGHTDRIRVGVVLPAKIPAQASAPEKHFMNQPLECMNISMSLSTRWW